ncbi:MAG: ATP-dependent helicase, partial [Chloroflexota bacterium]
SADARTLLLAAADPANPYGAALAWPRAADDDSRVFARAAGAYVVLHDGEPALYLDRGGRSIQTLPAFADPDTAHAALRCLAELLADGRLRTLQLEKVDGVPVSESAHRQRLVDAGFRASYRGYVLGTSAR